MSDLYKSDGVTAEELGMSIEALDDSVFSHQTSTGIRRESGLSLLRMITAATKSNGDKGAVLNVLSQLNVDQRDGLGHIIDSSGILSSAPTYRERSEARSISGALRMIG